MKKQFCNNTYRKSTPLILRNFIGIHWSHICLGHLFLETSLPYVRNVLNGYRLVLTKSFNTKLILKTLKL